MSKPSRESRRAWGIACSARDIIAYYVTQVIPRCCVKRAKHALWLSKKCRVQDELDSYCCYSSRNAVAAEQARVTGDHGGNEETENQANTVRMNITMVMYITEAIIYTAESAMKMVTMVVIMKVVIMKVVNMNENLQGNHHHHQPENKMVKDDERKTSYAKALN